MIRSKRKTSTKNILAYVGISLMIIVPSTIALVFFLSAPARVKKMERVIQFIPEEFDDGESALDHGWTSYTAHENAKFYNTSEGKVLLVNNKDYVGVDLRYNMTPVDNFTVEFLFKYNDSVFSGEIYGYALYHEGKRVFWMKFQGGAYSTKFHAWRISVLNNTVGIKIWSDDFDGVLKFDGTADLYSDYDASIAVPEGEVQQVDQFGVFFRNCATRTYILNMTGRGYF